MGLMQFLAPDKRRLASDAAARAHLTGLDGVPWLGRVVRTEAGLIADRPSGESGVFHCPWTLEGHGELTLCTASLMERPRAYHLPIELARGTLNRVRTQLAVWQNAGLYVSDPLQAWHREAMSRLRNAVLAQGQPLVAAQEADQSLSATLDLIDGLCSAFAEQVLAARQQAGGKLQTLFAVGFPDESLDPAAAATVASTFNTAVVPFRWSAVEPEDGRLDFSACDKHIFACQSQSMRVCGGPLLSFDVASMPPWLATHADDFDRLVAYVHRFIQHTVTRYQGRVHLWQCAGRMSTGDALPLRDEQKLRLVLRAVEAVRRFAPNVPAIVSIDLPWGEHLIADEHDLSPLHFADAVVRADLGLAGLGLEVNLGCHPHSTFPRDALAFSYLVDRWSVFNLPLVLSLGVPSSGDFDPLARRETQVLPGLGAAGPSPENQRHWVERLVPLLLAKNAVQGVFWNQLTDSLPHDFPHAGLLDAEGNPKPAVDSLRYFRQQHLA